MGSYERECRTLYVNYGGAGTLPADQVLRCVLVCVSHLFDSAGLTDPAAVCLHAGRPPSAGLASSCCPAARAPCLAHALPPMPAPARRRRLPCTSGRKPAQALAARPALHTCPSMLLLFHPLVFHDVQLRSIMGENFKEWGPLESLHLVPAKTIAFVR